MLWKVSFRGGLKDLITIHHQCVCHMVLVRATSCTCTCAHIVCVLIKKTFDLMVTVGLDCHLLY